MVTKGIPYITKWNWLLVLSMTVLHKQFSLQTYLLHFFHNVSVPQPLYLTLLFILDKFDRLIASRRATKLLESIRSVKCVKS